MVVDQARARRRIEERAGDRPVLPVCQSPYTPGYLVLRSRGELYKALVDYLPLGCGHFRGLGKPTAAAVTALVTRPDGARCCDGTHAPGDIRINNLQMTGCIAVLLLIHSRSHLLCVSLVYALAYCLPRYDARSILRDPTGGLQPLVHVS